MQHMFSKNWQGGKKYLVTNATFSSPSVYCFPYFSVWQTIPEVQSWVIAKILFYFFFTEAVKQWIAKSFEATVVSIILDYFEEHLSNGSMRKK